MSVRLAVVAVTLVFSAVLCAASKPGDITGYSSGDDVWTLGAKLASVNLAGFEKASESGDQDCYFDPLRTIKFAGQDTQVSVSLYFTNGRLSTFTINVDGAQKSYASLKQYYAGRLGKCKFYKHGPSSCEWVDKDKDYVSLGAVTDEASGADITAINYGWQSWVPVAE
jgi:hypothetical protein